jgi:uridine kinase
MEATVAAILDHLLAQPPRLGAGRLLSIDGPAGSGKTTLAAAVDEAARAVVGSVRLLHMDDVYEGWRGLGSAPQRLRNDVLEPLSFGRPGFYRRWDWVADDWAELHAVRPVDLLIVEGVGSGSPLLRDHCSTLVFVSAPADLRLSRGLARDGAAARENWKAWMADEDRHFADNGTEWAADLHVDALGRLVDSP